MKGEGFTLAEVVAALLVLEVGLLGAAALVVTARQTQAAAMVTERSVTLVAEVADSLAEAGFGGAGERATGWGVVRWVDEGGEPLATIRILSEDSARGRRLEAWTAVPRIVDPEAEG
ncbi:MAG: hypothetical protein GWM92_10040 [Gemmatimonadetes bacterium]|nr:hypothetical protein [Gemmatimonadota bacterium]NIR79014.1 hypothetical protein [Gemmatimonadota bacterium]NIT87658.1 hypothetical protein [Gemmatimonadota bacterium]NIU31525.1 hypothetical protein [Gemmatimonadota bacterium]NIU36185.1 hypothetical protein [Gemmatimonadota bacterium]